MAHTTLLEIPCCGSNMNCFSFIKVVKVVQNYLVAIISGRYGVLGVILTSRGSKTICSVLASILYTPVFMFSS